MTLRNLLADVFPRRLLCRYGCGFATFYGPRRDVHERTHSGDPAPTERTRR